MDPDTAKADAAAIDDLRAAVGRVSLEVQELSGRVKGLVSAVETLAPNPAGAPLHTCGPERRKVEVKVSPLPELAMAAVAETALRGLPAVGKVNSIERSNDQATFVLEVDRGSDLVAEIDRAMPVPIKVDEETDSTLQVALRWGRGRPAADAG